VILVAAFLLLVALGLLAAGLTQGSAALQWGSFAASALAALVLGVGELHRRRQSRADDDEPATAAVPARVGARAGTAAAPSEDGVPSPAASVVAPASTSRTAEVLPPPAAAGRPVGQGTPVVDDAPAEVLPPVGPPALASTVPSHAAPEGPPATGAHAAVPAIGADGEPPVEEVEVTDLLLVLDLTDEVLVVDEHPRYHLAGCPHLDGVATIPVPMDEARSDGFTPCGTCAPDKHLAQRERARRAG